MRGKCGVLAVTFSVMKNAPCFGDLFFGFPFWDATLECASGARCWIYFFGVDWSVRGLTSPQFEERNFAVKVLLISMLMGWSWEVPMTVE